MRITLVGIDPGIKDTAAVALTIDTDKKQLHVSNMVVNAIAEDPTKLTKLKAQLSTWEKGSCYYFIEGYRPRGLNVGQDTAMTALIKMLKTTFENSVVIDNTGVKNVIKNPVLRLLQLYKWNPTNHGDTRSAARIMLKGSFTIGWLNTILYLIITDLIEREDSWEIQRNIEVRLS